MENEGTGTAEHQSNPLVAMALCARCASGNPVKALGRNRVGEYGVLWGSPEQRDLYDEYFSRQTEELDAIFRAVGLVPSLYHHAMDGQAKTAVVGRIDVMQPDDTGLWVEAQLDLSNEYTLAIQRLVAEGKLHWSSGTLPGARKVADDGHILRWPIVEMSLTPTPAEYRMLNRPIETIRAAYKSIGLELPDLSQGKGAEDARHAARAKLGLLDLFELQLRSIGALI